METNNPIESAFTLVLNKLYMARDIDVEDQIILRCNNGRVSAHKAILEAGSDYFCGMLNYCYIENDTNMAFFPHITREVMDIVVKFIYAQQIPNTSEITNSLMRQVIITADTLQLNGLFDDYWNQFTASVSLDNFADVWQLAEMFNMNETIQNVRLFVLNNLQHISDTDLTNFTATRVESLIACSGSIANGIGNLISFILSWGTRKNEIEVASNLISKCNVGKLPDDSLRDLLSRNPEFYNVLSREAVSRWMIAAKPQVRIHAFEFNDGQCKHSVNLLDQKGWTCSSKCHRLDNLRSTFRGMKNWAPAVSEKGEIFYFNFLVHDSRFFVHEPATNSSYGQRSTVTLSDGLFEIETRSQNQIYFKADSNYSCFNLDNRKWCVVRFDVDQIDDCKRMILATDDGKFFFDVDDRKIKIVDTKSGICVTKEKSAGSWQSVKCRTISNAICAWKLMFFQKGTNSLLVYDIMYKYWSMVSLPSAEDDVILCVCYENESLVFVKSHISYKVYSLKEMNRVAEYRFSKYFDGFIHFDVTVDHPYR